MCRSLNSHELENIWLGNFFWRRDFQQEILLRELNFVEICHVVLHACDSHSSVLAAVPGHGPDLVAADLDICCAVYLGFHGYRLDGVHSHH